MKQPDALLQAIEELEKALEAFRAAYTAWLAGDGDGERLSRALAEAESRLDAARAMLAAAGDEASYP